MLDVEREGELVKLGEASVRCEGVSIHTGTGICVLWGVGVHIGLPNALVCSCKRLNFN